MAYYLSYIEINKHSALMLSHQETHDQPTRIICEFGFVPLESPGFFTTHKGWVGKEFNASRALYSKTADVRHRTYEISESEVQKFFEILNQDRRININFSRQGSISAQFKGRLDYQFIKNNCKTYVIGVMKQMGIIDAQNLSNIFIQQPGTKNTLLTPLSKEALVCPFKDIKIPLFFEDLKQLLLDYRKDLESNPDNSYGEMIKNKQDRFNQMETLFQQLLIDTDKIGIKNINAKNWKELKYILQDIDGYYWTQLTGGVSSPSYNDNIPTRVTPLLKTLEEILEVIKSNGKELEFFWKSTPPLANRLILSNFTSQEKGIYWIKIKGTEVSQGIEQILIDINSKMNQSRSFDSTLYLDLFDLKTILTNAKKDIEKTKKDFLNLINKKETDSDLTGICIQQKKAIDVIIENLENQLAEFKPKTLKSSSFVRYITRVIAYFKNDFLTVDNVESLIKKQIVNLKSINQSINYKSQISQMIDTHQPSNNSVKNINK